MRSLQKRWLNTSLLLLIVTTCQLNLDTLYAQGIDPSLVLRKGDIINNKTLFLKGYPDTLTIGAYQLIVEQYDKGGRWNALTKTYTGLTGIGRIQFNCGRRIVFPFPFDIWKGAVMKPVSVKIVDTVREESNEISIRDASLLGIKPLAGSQVELMLPHFGERTIALSRYLTDVVTVRRIEGIRVQFTDLTVRALQQGATKGLVIAGTATYPSDPPVPAVPFTLNIANGFQLQVSALTFHPTRDAVATAKLILPPSLTSNEDCAGAMLNLGTITISPRCEFYKELPDSTYGIFNVGQTTLGIRGRGYIVDFSTTRTYAPAGKPLSWKGVVLPEGESPGTPGDTVISNIGYMQAHYGFVQGFVESTGLTASFLNKSPYSFGTTQPLGYNIKFGNANVNVAASRVTGGSLTQGTVTLPRTAIRHADDATVQLTDIKITIRPNMDLAGNALSSGKGLYWGDLIAAGGADRKSFGVENISREAFLFFSATPRRLFQPVESTGTGFVTPFSLVTLAALDSFGIQGATFNQFSVIVINAPDIPGTWKPNDPVMPWQNSPVRFMLSGNEQRWLNVITEGVHCNITGSIFDTTRNYELGDPSEPLYVGVKPFQVQTRNKKRTFGSIIVQCVESAVITCNFSAFINEPAPINTQLAFKEMVFTSTANNAGGKLAVAGDDSLTYWGLKLVPKPGFASSGLVSVKTGQIILTAAGLAEQRHFAQPFWITWGEMLANGTMGRLFFDFNSAGQQFDGFPFVHDAVALSPFDPSAKAFLRVGGKAHFPFFGGDYLHIQDFYDPALPDSPFNKRVIELSDQSIGSFLPSDTTISGNWMDGTGIFNFTISYAAISQDGFLGTGASAIRNLLGGALGATLDMNSRGTCIRIGSNLMDQRSVSLGPIANISNITRIWGCACIKNDGIENLVVGGEVTNAANFMMHARTGAHLSAVLQLTPALTRLTVDGEAYLSLASALDAVVNGHTQLTLNTAEGFVEGEVQGKLRVAEGALFVGSSLEAEGQVNWHLGADFQELQGMVALKIMSLGEGQALASAFYIGKNAPKSRAWVLTGADPRYNLNMEVMPERLTGVYGSIHYHDAVRLYVVSGSYDIYVGLGAFVLTPEIASQLGGLTPTVGLPYVVGNLGGRIHGDILGGFVSAAAYFNLQLIGPYPFSFEGTVGLEGCVLWVACKSVDITVGLNSTRGFYVY